MKLKTAAISIVVSVALVGSAGYGAYYAVQKQKKPVDVVPVEYVNMGRGYWGDEVQSIYGSVTSQVAQTVVLNEEYAVDKVFVKTGDTVKEGTPLFSYDMTLEELELEMEQLDMQTLELTMTKLEKDLEKLKSGKVSASLTGRTDVLTAEGEDAQTSGEQAVPEGSGQQTPDAGAPEENGTEMPAEVIEETEAAGGGELQDGAGAQQDGTATPEDSGSITQDGGLTIEGIETVESAPESDSDRTEMEASMGHYGGLVNAIDALFEAHGDSLKADEVGEAIKTAVAYYREKFADEVTTQKDDGSGSLVTVRTYEIKESVRTALAEEGTKQLEELTDKLNGYHVRYVEMLISEAESAGASMPEEELAAAIAVIRENYDLLATKQQGEVGNLGTIEVLEQLAAGGEAESGTGTETESGTETGAESESGTETGAESESGTETGAGSESETETGTESESDTQPQEADTYQVEIQYLDEKGNAVTSIAPASYKAGETVTLSAPDGEALLADFLQWEIEAPQSLKDSLTAEALKNPVLSFTMPQEGVKLTARYHSYEEKIERYVKSFLDMADDVLADGASASEDYVTRLETAIAFYQYWLAEVPGSPADAAVFASETMPPAEEIVDTLLSNVMEYYELRDVVRSFLQQQTGDDIVDVEVLEHKYETLCMTYVRFLFEKIDADAISAEDTQKAQRAYDALGPGWQASLEEQWQASNAALGITVPAIGDSLKAYPVLMAFQEYKKLAPNLSKDEKKAALKEIMQSYYLLSEPQRQIVASVKEFVKTMKKFGLWDPDEPVTEPDTEPFYPGDDDWGDGGDSGYTAEELKEMIEEKEREIKECELDMREKKLSVDQKQRIVDGKTVKSTMDGTVISIGEQDGTSDYDYFVKVANESGLFAKGAMSELALANIHVGDKISGMMTDTGVSFTAVIKEISEYPDENGSMSFGYGMENSNASYYPFYALLDSTEDIEEGEAEIQLSASMSSGEDGIYLEPYFVKEEKDGRSYVWKQGENSLLTKQYVITGKTIYGGMAVEIRDGLETTDKIAFPYGKDVKEGAKTREVDSLD